MKRLVQVLLIGIVVLGLSACGPGAGGGDPSDGLHSIVPDVVGLDDADARATLEDAGYVVGAVTEEPSDVVAPGAVISQSPIANISAPRDSAVDLVIATP